MDPVRPTSADMALLHLVSWWMVRPWSEKDKDGLMLSQLALVLPAANRGLPMIDAFAGLAERVLALAPGETLSASLLRAEGAAVVAVFHARRGGEALDVFKKGKTDAA